MVGTTRARVSFFVNKFRRLGLHLLQWGDRDPQSLLNVVLHDQPHIILTGSERSPRRSDAG